MCVTIYLCSTPCEKYMVGSRYFILLAVIAYLIYRLDIFFSISSSSGGSFLRNVESSNSV